MLWSRLFHYNPGSGGVVEQIVPVQQESKTFINQRLSAESRRINWGYCVMEVTGAVSLEIDKRALYSGHRATTEETVESLVALCEYCRGSGTFTVH